MKESLIEQNINNIGYDIILALLIEQKSFLLIAKMSANGTDHHSGQIGDSILTRKISIRSGSLLPRQQRSKIKIEDYAFSPSLQFSLPPLVHSKGYKQIHFIKLDFPQAYFYQHNMIYEKKWINKGYLFLEQEIEGEKLMKL